MSLKSKLKTGVLATGLGLAGACSTMDPYETRDICNDLFIFTPKVLEPASCQDAREEIRERETEKRRMERERNIVTYITSKGNPVNLRISDKVVYRGKNHMVWEVNHPYIEIIPLNEKGDGYDLKNSFPISIKELDMFKK